MIVEIEELRRIVTGGSTSRVWPNNAQNVLAKSQGDYDFDPAWLLEPAAAWGAEIAFEDALPSIEEPLWMEDYPHLFGYHQFFVANLLVAASRGAQARVVDGDLDDGDLVVAGGLHVKGDLRVGQRLVVAGDLRVDGDFVGTDDFTSHAVIGDVDVHGMMLVRGETFVAGSVRCPQILVHNPDWVGFLRVLGELETELFIESELDEFGRSIVDGRVTASVAIPPHIAGRSHTPEQIRDALASLRDDVPEDAAAVRDYATALILAAVDR